VRKSCLALLLCLGAWIEGAGAADDALVQMLSQRLHVHDGVQGLFQQEKQLPFMQMPLKSSGSFSLPRENCLTWQVEDPVASSMLVRGESVLLDGEVVNDRGVGRMIALLIQGLMNGDLEQVSDRFSVAGDVAEEGWRLTLVPKNLLVGQVLERIEARGHAQVDEVLILEKAGATTTIMFSDVRDYSGGPEDSCVAVD